MRTTLFTAVAGLGCGLGLAAGPDPADDVPALIRKLGSPGFADREEAARKLGEMPAALGPLRDAAGDKNPEVARRAQEVLGTLTKRVGGERLKRLPGYVKARQLDRMVEVVVAWREAVSVEDRELVRAAAADVVGWAGREFGPGGPAIKVPKLERKTGPGSYTKLTLGKQLSHPQFGDKIAESVDQSKIGGGLVIRDGGFVCVDGPTFTNGNLSYLPDRLNKFVGLFVCNGDMTLNQTALVEDAMIICTGDVRFEFGVENSLVVAGGDITLRQNLEEHALKNKTVFRRKEKKLAEFLKFYDAAAEGLHVRAEGKTVVVTGVDAGKPFAKAGLRAGDRILRVNDVGVSDVRGLNRLLCRAEVGHPGAAVVSVARGDRGVEATVKLAD